MAQTLYQSDQNSLLYLSDLRIANIANKLYRSSHYYIGKKPTSYDLFKSLFIRDIVCNGNYDECDLCNINALLNSEKCDELRLQ